MHIVADAARISIYRGRREREKELERDRGEKEREIAPAADTYISSSPPTIAAICTPIQGHVSHVSPRDFLCITSSARARAQEYIGREREGKEITRESEIEREWPTN